MRSDEYWPRLEFRVTRELAGLRDERLRSLWCDGFIPEAFDASEGVGLVTGRTWIGIGGRQQESWEFSLVVGDARESADWSPLLPPDDVTGWMSLDVEAKMMKIDPLAAYPDLSVPRH